jgi:hypothetical protein
MENTAQREYLQFIQHIQYCYNSQIKEVMMGQTCTVAGPEHTHWFLWNFIRNQNSDKRLKLLMHILQFLLFSVSIQAQWLSNLTLIWEVSRSNPGQTPVQGLKFSWFPSVTLSKMSSTLKYVSIISSHIFFESGLTIILSYTTHLTMFNLSNYHTTIEAPIPLVFLKKKASNLFVKILFVI